MSNSTSLLDVITVAQGTKETSANAMFDAASQSMIFGRRASTTTALTWGYYGGRFTKGDGTNIAVANATIALSASLTNYIEVDTAGSVTKNTIAFTAGQIPLYTVVTGASTVTSYTDHRNGAQGNFLSVGGGDVDGPASAASNAVALFDGTTGKVIKDGGAVSALSVASAAALTTPRTIGGTSFDGSADITQPFDVSGFYPGIPTASAIVMRIPIARAVTFAANFAGSHFNASANATATTVFDVQRNGSTIGSISIAAGGIIATFTTSGGTLKTFAAGDVLKISCPATPDTTLADIGLTLAGTR